MTKSLFAVRAEDALSWHHAAKHQAAVAERSGLRVRALAGRGWEVWATDEDFGLVVVQAGE